MINDTERRVLISLHLRGCMGNCGSMTSKQRGKLLQGLIDKELLTINGQVTKRGQQLCK